MKEKLAIAVLITAAAYGVKNFVDVFIVRQKITKLSEADRTALYKQLDKIKK